MKILNTVLTFTALKNAVDAVDTSGYPGEWIVEARTDGRVYLIWWCDEADVMDMDCDDPWINWGGAEIIIMANFDGPYPNSGCNSFRSGCNSFRSNGINKVTQWTVWYTGDQS
jgi:hypothetical protein